jgi:hypothetical protein
MILPPLVFLGCLTPICLLVRPSAGPLEGQTSPDTTYFNGTARFKKCKQLFEYQHLLLLRDIW